jgi:hypothetical protein
MLCALSSAESEMAEQLPSSSTLRAALAALSAPPADPAARAAADAQRRLACVRLVRQLWLSDGGRYDPASLASHFVDGTAWALERFLYSGAELPDRPADSAARQCGIPVVNATDLSYDEFFRRHLLSNTPVVVRGVTSSWNAARDWVTPHGTPDVRSIGNMFPDACAPVVGLWADEPTRAASKQTRVGDYAQWWERTHGGDQSADCDTGRMPLDGDQLYLKDWHFATEHADAYRAYTCPIWFRDDWLHPPPPPARASVSSRQAEQRLEDRGRDHRFVYLGPAGSTTRMHCDVMASYSWSVNVCGAKRWLLLPPSATPLLYDGLGEQMATDLDESCSWFGGLEAARAQAIELIQQSGEALFVPSGWHHSVCNLQDTLSINHNWINACNLTWAVDHVLARLSHAGTAGVVDRDLQTATEGKGKSKSGGKVGAAEQEARVLGSVVAEAAARAAAVCQDEAAEEAARLKAAYDLHVAQVALERLRAVGVGTYT